MARTITRRRRCLTWLPASATASDREKVEFGNAGMGSAKASRSKRVVAASIKMVEQPLPLDHMLSYNSLVSHKEDFYTFDAVSVLIICLILSLILAFGAMIAYTLWRDNRPDVRAQHIADLRRMYIADGGIEAFAFPHSVGEHVSCGMCVVCARCC